MTTAVFAFPRHEEVMYYLVQAQSDTWARYNESSQAKSNVSLGVKDYGPLDSRISAFSVIIHARTSDTVRSPSDSVEFRRWVELKDLPNFNAEIHQLVVQEFRNLYGRNETTLLSYLGEGGHVSLGVQLFLYTGEEWEHQPEFVLGLNRNHFVC